MLPPRAISNTRHSLVISSERERVRDTELDHIAVSEMFDYGVQADSYRFGTGYVYLCRQQFLGFDLL
jgi:hypothetical protein